ncbi:hypothetical protein FQZ97_1172480 [compost metagenome]
MYAEPVGFDGELKMSHLVFGVMAFSRSLAVSLKLSSIFVLTKTGVPPLIATISG